jgi:predicted glycosyltransferase
MVLDPYLPPESAEALRQHPLSNGVRFMSFVPDLVELIHHSELVISRAGYNVVNEILLTGTKAVIIPESHGGGEQELRVQSVHEENIRTVTEDQIFNDNSGQLILDFLNSPIHLVSNRFDKYAIGKTIIDDLENWKASRKECT